MGWRTAAIWRRPPGPGAAGEGRGGLSPRTGGLRRDLRRRGHPRLRGIRGARGRRGAATMGDVTPPAASGRPASRPKARDLNQVIRYTMWSVFKAVRPLPEDRAGAGAEVQELFDQLAAKDVTV